MDESRPATAHPSDGELLALHDSEPSEETAQTRLHLDACETCRARFDSISAAANVVHSALMNHPVSIPRFEPRTRREERGAPSLRRRRVPAGGIMALLAAGAAVAAAAIPVRHWFQSREPVQSIVKAPPSDSVPVAPKPRPSTRISFVLAGDELTIRLDSLPSSGYLTVDRTTTSQVSLAPEGADGTADSTAVLPNEIRLYDKRGAALRYRLTIPTRAVRLRVVVQGDTTFNGPPLGRIPLAEMR